jgi:hypothetical protein
LQETEYSDNTCNDAEPGVFSGAIEITGNKIITGFSPEKVPFSSTGDGPDTDHLKNPFLFPVPGVSGTL